MPTLLEVPCFRYLGNDIAAQLVVEQQADAGTALVRCLVRNRLCSLTPEERVRQGILWFLVEGAESSAAWGKQLRIEVEQRSLDVAAFYAGDAIHSRFSPAVPVIIIETKRRELELDEAMIDEQLGTYMVREGCRAGLAFSARQAAWLSLEGKFTQPIWAKKFLADLSEAEERINEAIATVARYVADCERLFASAATGNFDALLELVLRLGSSSGLTFVVSVRSKGSVAPVQAFNMQALESNLATYRARGVVSRNRQQLRRQDFHALMAVRPL